MKTRKRIMRPVLTKERKVYSFKPLEFIRELSDKYQMSYKAVERIWVKCDKDLIQTKTMLNFIKRQELWS